MAEKRISDYDFQAEVFKNRQVLHTFPPLLHSDEASLSPESPLGRKTLHVLQVMSCKGNAHYCVEPHRPRLFSVTTV